MIILSDFHITFSPTIQMIHPLKAQLVEITAPGYPVFSANMAPDGGRARLDLLTRRFLGAACPLLRAAGAVVSPSHRAAVGVLDTGRSHVFTA